MTHPVPAGLHAPVQRETQPGFGGLRQDRIKANQPFYLLVSLKWVCFVQTEEQQFPALHRADPKTHSAAEPARLHMLSALLLSKYWDFCVKTTKCAEKQSSGEG